VGEGDAERNLTRIHCAGSEKDEGERVFSKEWGGPKQIHKKRASYRFRGVTEARGTYIRGGVGKKIRERPRVRVQGDTWGEEIGGGSGGVEKKMGGGAEGS